MPTIDFRVTAESDELLDAGEGLGALLDGPAQQWLELCPALLRLLLELDEAIAAALREAEA
ncbi:MAG TPA: hypothetical protein VFA19_09395 [Gaiellaceae bacterium]|nr:hypothetical protein [Gaiellaceae bacterium]